MMTAHLKHLRLSAEKKKVEIQEVRRRCVRFDFAAAKRQLEAHFSLLEEMEDLPQEKAMTIKWTMSLLQQLKEEIDDNKRIMKSRTERVSSFEAWRGVRIRCSSSSKEKGRRRMA